MDISLNFTDEIMNEILDEFLDDYFWEDSESCIESLYEEDFDLIADNMELEELEKIEKELKQVEKD